MVTFIFGVETKLNSLQNMPFSIQERKFMQCSDFESLDTQTKRNLDTYGTKSCHVFMFYMLFDQFELWRSWLYKWELTSLTSSQPFVALWFRPGNPTPFVTNRSIGSLELVKTSWIRLKLRTWTSWLLGDRSGKRWSWKAICNRQQ